MAKRSMANKAVYRGVSLLLSVITTVSCFMPVRAVETIPSETAKQTVNLLADEDLSSGVHYTEEDIVNYRGKDGHRLRANHLVVDPSDSNTKIISSKAMDTVGGRETILQQANREILKGNLVVAGINADSYDIDSGSGISRGIHVQNGHIIQSQPTDNYTSVQPAFYVRQDGTVEIGPLNAAGSITVGDAEPSAVPLLNRNDFTYATDANSTRIFTRNITETHKLTHISSHSSSPVPAKKGFALIKVDGKDFDGTIEAGKTYTGTVKKTETADGFTIPDGYLVYAGYGDSADTVSSLAAGTSVSYTCNLYTGEGFRAAQADQDEAENDVAYAVTSFQLLAKDGVKNDSVMESGKDDNARTVIGVTEDGTIHMLSCNKPSTNMTKTKGTSFSDITDYMMEELDCTDVLNMDGGGSTTMVARRVGSDALATVNYPSDGTDRIVGNSLLIVNTAEKSAEVSQVVLGADVNVFKNSHYDFTVKLTDENGNKISSSGHEVKWEAEKGKVDASGRYQAPAEAGEDTVTATVDGVSGSVKVAVQDTVASFSLSVSGTLALQKGEKRKLELLSYDETGARTYIDPASADWKLKNEGVVTVEGGEVSPLSGSGETDLTVTFLKKPISLHIIVGMKEQIIDDFESDTKIDGYRVGGQMYNKAGYQNGGGDNKGNKDKYIGFETAETENSRVKSGRSSLRLTYHTDNWTRASNGTFNFYPLWDDLANYSGTSTWSEQDRAAMESRFTAKAMPKKFGLWVYSGDENHDGISDNYDCMMTAVFLQKSPGYNKPGCYDHSVSLKLTPDEHIDWIGWKWVEAEIPQDWEMPIIFNYFWISNINKTAASYQTSLLFDDLKYIYTDDRQDLEGPVFSDTTPKSGPYTKNAMQVSTTITDSGSGVDADSIQITVDGTSYTGEKKFDAATGKLSFTVAGLEDQTSCRVVVTAKDKTGNASTSYVDNTYQIDLGPDNEKPVITDVTPTRQVPVQISRPRVGFNLSDVKSGIDPSSIQVLYGTKKISDVYYDENTGWGYAQPDWDLTEGDCALKINAKDNAGNQLEYTDTILIKPIAQPKDPKNFKIDIIPDTQGNAYSERFAQKMAANDSDFVIHLGDITDGATEQEYKDAKTYQSELGKPLFVIPGNHEASLNTLDLFYQYFGSPTYTFTYGNTRFIMLNSAYRQSISTSDSTQYHYLQDVLDHNTSENVYVINHVITRDHYYTEHNMTAEEAERFEKLLSAYKAKKPDVNVSVLFGHLHTLDNWQVGGVNYIISGNAAGKGYVTPDQGNMLGTGTVTVKEGRAGYKFDPYLTAVYIKNDALIGNTIKTFQSADIQLNLYGDFREYPANYITQLNSHELVDIAWTSSDPNVASVSKLGVVTAKKTGTTRITAVSGGKNSSVTVDVRNASDAKVTKLDMTLPASIQAGETLIPTVKGTDAYGTVFALNNKDVQFTFKNGLMKAVDGSLQALKQGRETVTAQYGGLTAAADVTVTAKVKPSDPNPGSGSPTVPSKPNTGENGFKSDTTADLTVKGRYQFKITSTDGKAPVFVVGTPGVFQVKLVKTEGSDYYYQVTAVGQQGARAGVYVNGSRLLVLTVGTSEATFVSDTISDMTVDHKYQFKITSTNGKAPVFSVGTPGVFEVKLAKKDGNNYYYCVTAIGKTGDRAGLYVNGQRLLVLTAGAAEKRTFVSDTTLPLNVSQNGAYQFKIRSMNGKAPVFVVGTPGVFAAGFVKKSGDDYYYQIKATGTSGAQAGVYVDGVKLLVATVISSVQSDTNIPVAVKSGASYVFKLTAASKPAFKSGNNSVFKVVEAGSKGHDYFFRVTAVGKAGQSAGFYINNEKSPRSVGTVK